jgi:putative endonuclease
MYFVYILKSEKDKKYYYGSIKDIVLRLKRHNKGEVRATKSGRPLVLHYKEEYQTRSEAYQREMFLKTIGGYNWLKEKTII